MSDSNDTMMILEAVKAAKEELIAQFGSFATRLESQRGASAQSISNPVELNDTEENILETLSKGPMHGSMLALKSGYDYNTPFKTTVAALVRHGIIGWDKRGYHLLPRHDKGQD
jgi:hypothetical protein